MTYSHTPKQLSNSERWPDDNTTKEVFLSAAGTEYTGHERHVHIFWNNYDSNYGFTTQVIELNGVSSTFSYDNTVKRGEFSELEESDIYPLGDYTKVQRDRIIELAEAVKFDKESTVNGNREWIWDLLKAMVKDDLLDQPTVDMIAEQVPLLERQEEL